MLMLLMGLIDILISIILILKFFNHSFKTLIIIAAIYLAIKGLIFIKSFASIIDLFAAAVLIAALFFSIPPMLLWIAAILLVQKGIFSFF